MKLVILIPAYNEEKTIEETILDIPRKIHGIDNVQVMVINDGSTDRTVDFAMNAGADSIISHKTNLGVGAAFMTGIRNAISMNADLVVTVDADNQFVTKEIPALISPILSNQFDVIIGSRFLKNNQKEFLKEYPKIKLIGNKIFTNLVSLVAGQKFSDTQTGFRAYSKDSIASIAVVNDFTYTQEVLLDLKFKGFRIGDVPIINKNYRKDSKVTRSLFRYTYKSLAIIMRSLIYHRPMMAFGLFGAILVGGGILAKVLTITIDNFHITSGLSTGLIILGIVSFMMGGFASVVFRRQAFTEKDLHYFLKESKKESQ